MRGNVVDMAVGIIYVLDVSRVSPVSLVSQLFLLSVHS
jgi:large-conductance mechanosensitive channel